MPYISRITLGFALALSLSAPANAAVISIVSNTTDWRLSTFTATNDAVPWPGWLAPLPDAATYTLTPVRGAGHVHNVGGDAINLAAGNGIRFYRTVFSLPAFTALTADVRMSVDNDMHIFVNGNPLALEGSLLLANFADAQDHRLFVAENGAVTNGFLGGQIFDSVTSPFPQSNWNSGGANEIVLVVRNLSGGDAGGLSFGIQVTTADLAVPEPAALALLSLATLGFAGSIRRRHDAFGHRPRK
jgi:hypothetical protein